jgi:two-component system sensor histidine kinase HydH
VELEVTDDGPGIPTEQQPHIFVPFYTTKQKGTGLGLAICQRIVKNHGGSISVQSRVGEGTSFVVRLPAVGPNTGPRVMEVPRDATPAPGEVTFRRPPRDRSRRRQTQG